MALSIDELIEPISKDQALDFLLAILASHGFPVASWQSGSIERTTIEAFAELASEKLLVANKLARAGLLSLSEADWLDLLSDSHYDNQRFAAVKTAGKILLTDAESTGPHTIGVDEVVVSDADGRRYRNTGGGTLALDSTLLLDFEAEVAGTDSNVPNDTITVGVTAPPGVTVNNPVYADDTWITQAGANEESDSSLQERDRTKWATLGVNGPSEAYVNWAREADSAVTRVFVDAQNPDGPGTLTVYLAGDDGAVDATVRQAVEDYIEGTTDQIRRKALGAILTVVSATAHPIDFQGAVYCDPAKETGPGSPIQQLVDDALLAFVRAVPIGGVKSLDDEDGQVLLGRLYYSLFSIEGVVNVVLTAPTSNLALAKNEVATIGISALATAAAAF